MRGNQHIAKIIKPTLTQLSYFLSDESIPLYSAQIEEAFPHLIDLIIDPGEYDFIGNTTIVDFTSGAPEVIREGAGASGIFR